MTDMLPRLFFVHFRSTSFVAETAGNVIGFLAGFVSQTHPGEAYIHFAGVHPEFRRKGVGHSLYCCFFKVVTGLERNVVRCVTSPVNRDSIAFHRRAGFTAEPGDTEEDGIPIRKNYDGPGQDRVLFVKHLN
jgi:ribosomal protein S18 acetylase RimI-like enzyme